MKNLSFVFLLWIIAQSTFAQSVIEDAILIGMNTSMIRESSGRLQIPDDPQYYTILAKYTTNPLTTSKESIRTAFVSNPFIYVPTGGGQFSPLLAVTGSTPSSFIGNLPVTGIADGLAKFLVERTKTELNTAFFKRFKEELNSDKYKDLTSLFPATVSLLNVIETDIYQFDHYLNALRQAFEEDLRSIFDHLPAVLDNHRNESFFVGRPELEHSLYLALDIAQWVKGEKHPGEILALLAINDHLKNLSNSGQTIYRDAANSIRLVAFISESFRRNDRSLGYWVDANQLSRLRNDLTFQIYLGLLYQQCSQAPFDNIQFPVLTGAAPSASQLSLKDLLDYIGTNWTSVQPNVRLYQDFILNVGKRTQSIMQAIEVLTTAQEDIINNTELTRKAKQQKLFDLSLDVFQQMISLAKLSTTIDKLPYIKIVVSDKFKQAIGQLELVGSIAVHINHKQYGGAISKFAIFLENILLEKDQDKKRRLHTDLIDFSDQTKAQNKIALYDQIDLLIMERDKLKPLPCFKGKKKQIRGIKRQIASLEKQAALIVVRLKTPDTQTLNNKKTELSILLTSTSLNHKEKKLLNKQLKAIDQQIDGVLAQSSEIPSTVSNKEALRKILRYGTFMANIVEAESSEEAKKAIEAIALPPGSYSIKRQSKFSVALNGYVGIFGGGEYIRNANNNSLSNNFGITAPVGFSFSWGNIWSKKMRPWSLGFSVPIIDLGAVASYRFSNPDKDNAAETVPTIQLKHLVAPGLFLEVGIGGTPLTFGVGSQVGPRLRGIRNSTYPSGQVHYAPH
ncbi:MAG: hypothetical protein ACKV1O_17475 [Saprospiraceae bacterium]